MTNQLRLLAKIGGVVIICGGLTAYYFSKQNKTVKSFKIFDRETVIKVLKELDKQNYTILQNIAVSFQEISSQVQGKMDKQEIKDHLLNELNFQDQISEIQSNVFQKFQISEEEFQQAVHEQFKDDKNIQNLCKKLVQEIEQAQFGQVPNHQTDIPDILDYQKTLLIFTEISKDMTLHIFDCIQQAKELGFGQNPLMSPQIQEQLNPMILEKKKENILTSNGLGDFEDSPMKIYKSAIEYYLKNNKKFLEIYKILETHHQKLMGAILKNQSLEREKIQEGYSSLLDFEFQKIKMEKIIQQEQKHEQKIQSEYYHQIEIIESKLKEQQKMHIAVDSINQQVIHNTEFEKKTMHTSQDKQQQSNPQNQEENLQKNESLQQDELVYSVFQKVDEDENYNYIQQQNTQNNLDQQNKL